MAEIVSRVLQAMEHHTQGRLSTAESLYLGILKDFPDLFDALHLLGVVKLQQGNPAEAVQLIQRAISVNPDSAPAYSNLANAFIAMQSPDKAIDALRSAINADPTRVEASFGLGNLLFQLGRVAEAIQCFGKVVTTNPGHLDAHHNKAVALMAQGNYNQAIEAFNQGLLVNARHAGCLFNQALCYYETGQFQSAVNNYDLLIAQLPGNVDVHCNRGMALQGLKLYELAEISYRKALAINPDDARSLCNLAVTLQRTQRLEDALVIFNQAIVASPNFADAYSNRGALFHALGRDAEAIRDYEHALLLNPQHLLTLCNKGALLYDSQNYSEALECYAHALAISPSHADAHWNRSLCRLCIGDYEQGWPEYEWRWKLAETPSLPAFSRPLWLGESDIRGQTLLIHSEQGLGDAIQFSRYTKVLKEMGASVIMAVAPSLKKLMADSLGCHVIAHGEAVPQYDLHCPIMSLPLALRTKLDSIPAITPYLFANPAKQSDWKKRVGNTKRLKIGICWSGNSNHSNDRNRSIPLRTVSALLELKADFHILQKEIRGSDVDDLKELPSLVDWRHALEDFSDTAGLVEEMDMVLSVDTSLAHLAGAMNKPVWLLIPFAHDWRWLNDRNDSPWYPSMQIFRQKSPGDWETLISAVKTELMRKIG